MSDARLPGPWLTRRFVLAAGAAPGPSALAAPPAEPSPRPPPPPPARPLRPWPRIDIVCGGRGGGDVSRDA